MENKVKCSEILWSNESYNCEVQTIVILCVGLVSSEWDFLINHKFFIFKLD